MNIVRRTKTPGRGKTVSVKKNLIPIVFDLQVLDLFCAYIMSNNRSIRRSHFLNIRNLISILDITLYQNDVEKMKRIEFISRGLEGRLEKRISNDILLLKYVNGGIIDSDVVDLDNVTILSSEELDWINETVSEALKYSFIYNHIDEMQDLCVRFKATDYRYRGEIVRELELLIDEMKANFRRVKVESLADMTFSLRDGIFESIMEDVYNQMINPSRRLVTGMQGFNMIVNGGFESGRVYLFAGLAGAGKSMAILNLINQIKRYNKGYNLKDPTKTPVVVLLTQENSVRETITRLFQICTSIDAECMKDMSFDDVLDRLRIDGELYLTDDSPIDIIIKYQPSGSVDTTYMYTLTEDLEDEGYEVIAFFQDHIKKMKSCYKQSDLRIELGEIINEFKTFAILKDIPVITITHLNRDAAKTVEAGSMNNKPDMIRMLGSSNVGESMLMIDNTDLAYVFGREYDKNGIPYFVFSNIKKRDRLLREYVCLPTEVGNPIKLVEDYYSPIPVFRESMHENNAGVPLPKIQPSSYSNIGVLEEPDINDEEDDDILSKISKYSSSSVHIPVQNFIPEVAGTQMQSPIKHHAISFDVA